MPASQATNSKILRNRNRQNSKLEIHLKYNEIECKKLKYRVITSITIYDTDLPTSFGSKTKTCHAMMHTITKIIKLQTSILPLRRNTRKDTANRHKATNYIN